MKKMYAQFKKTVLLIHQLNHKIFLVAFLEAFFHTLVPYLSLWFTASLLNQITRGTSFQTTLLSALFFIGAIFVADTLLSFFENIQMNLCDKIDLQLSLKTSETFLRISYAQLQDPQIRDEYEKAKGGAGYGGGIYWFIRETVESFFKGIVALLFGLYTFVLVYQSRTTVTTSLGAWTNHWSYLLVMILLIVVVFLLNILLSKRSNVAQKELFDKMNFINKTFSYFYGTLDDYHNGPFFRLYQAKDYLLQLYKENNHATYTLMSQVFARLTNYQIVGQVATFTASATLYTLVGLKAYYGALPIGSVILYAGYFSLMMTSLSELFEKVVQGTAQVQYLEFFFDFLQLQSDATGTLPIEKRNDREYQIEFHDVSFKYPGSDAWALRHVSLKLNIGEKIAVVGLNGSGKTTFIKLLCRLYPVTKGAITLNGININKYDPQEYQEIFGVVFQDFQLFAYSLGENIATDENYDEQRITEALHIAGLTERVAKLPRGIQTSLYKDIDAAGVELSGGEAQKVAIARAWYKDAPFIVLDEPTSALDPYSEYEIYKRFNDLVEDRTSIYISHRMSSARFAQKIIVFADGEIIETGTHSQLMAQQGLYAELFQAQAQYYAKEKDQKSAALFA